MFMKLRICWYVAEPVQSMQQTNNYLNHQITSPYYTKYVSSEFSRLAMMNPDNVDKLLFV